MKTYTFTCAVRIAETGDLMPIYGLQTPPVTCSTPTEAIYHPDVKAFCATNQCVVYQIVGR